MLEHRIRHFLSLCILGLFAKVAILAQPVGVNIVFDNSGSMNGSQCISANYTLKVLAALLDEKEFDLRVVEQRRVNSAEQILLRSSGRQQYLDRLGWSCASGGIYSQSIKTAMKEFNRGSRDKWLVILSDGLVNDTEKFDTELVDFVNRGGRIVYINTDRSGVAENRVFHTITSSVQSTHVDIHETESKPDAILKAMDKVARQLLSSDIVPIPFTIRGNTLTVHAPIPLRSLTVLEQSTTGRLTTISSAINDQQTLSIKHSLKISQGQLSGGVHRLLGPTSREIIHSGDIHIDFTQNISSSQMTVIAQPMVDIEVEVTGDIHSSTDNVYKVCADDVTLTVRVVTSDDGTNWHPVSPAVSRNTQIHVEYLSKKLKLSFQDSLFIGHIKMTEAHVPVHVTARYEGLFNIKRNAAILDRDTCSVGTVVMPPLPTFTVDELNDPSFRGFQYLPRIIINGNERDVTPEEFERLQLRGKSANSCIDIHIDKDNPAMHWFVKPRTTAWCQCLLKGGTYLVDIEMISTDGRIPPVRKELEIAITTEGATFMSRCGKFIALLLLALFLIWYLWGIYRKRRFYSGAMIEYWKQIDITTRPYTENLSTGFLNRYLVPYLTETNTIEGMKFIAGHRNAYIEVPSENLSDQMSIGGVPVDPEIKYNLKLSDGEVLSISSGRRTEYYKYISNAN